MIKNDRCQLINEMKSRNDHAQQLLFLFAPKH